MRGICHNQERERREKKRKLGEVSGWRQERPAGDKRLCLLIGETLSMVPAPTPQFFT